MTGLEPGRRLAWDTRTSGARWIWELEPTDDGRTRVVHRRPVPRGLTGLSRLAAPLLLGGTDAHADELEAGMARTVARLGSARRCRGRVRCWRTGVDHPWVGARRGLVSAG